MPTLRGKKDGPDADVRSIPSALARFKANPSGPDAREDIVVIARAVESITDASERTKAARLLAKEFATAIDEAGPAQKSEVVSTIGFGLDESPTMIRALRDETDIKTQQDAKPRRERVRERPRPVYDGDRVIIEIVGVDPFAGTGYADLLRRSGRGALSDSQRMITPDDPVVLRAVKEAVRKKGPLSIDQICDIFDYVVRKIEYLNTSHPTEPRLPAVTLEAGIGDCKCMSVALASMLEAIGAKTILVSAKNHSSDLGHEFIGVMISEEPNDYRRGMVKNAVRAAILSRYDVFIGLVYMKNTELQFVELEVRGKKQTYLLLEATTGPTTVPGKTGSFDEVGYHESRPGIVGMTPSV
ncbi:Uncharacterised protein [Candidatus Bilamarchaeum dharawalense]|uniref:Transglutaminase-like domain-containing protein n=1 Tax=Candidatus Bilamarchaeum dharawalense TaxID=2885759 RepID=A0A5E4LWY6_9ARCH|nr:Uncharacterised protein [Candidatus Bilamarchaeum dharawalense]